MKMTRLALVCVMGSALWLGCGDDDETGNDGSGASGAASSGGSGGASSGGASSGGSSVGGSGASSAGGAGGSAAGGAGGSGGCDAGAIGTELCEIVAECEPGGNGCLEDVTEERCESDDCTAAYDAWLQCAVDLDGAGMWNECPDYPTACDAERDAYETCVE